jgi:peptide/nickel transport system permease protein
MLRYVLSRIVQGAFNLLVITLLLFLVVRLTGDPVAALLPIGAPQEQYDTLREYLKLDDPLYAQYGSYLAHLFQGDLGISIVSKQPVTTLIGERIPNTLQLGMMALVFTLVVSIVLGVYAAARARTPIDRGTRAFAILGQSVPPFLIGIFLIQMFPGSLPTGDKPSITHLIFPALAIAAPLTAGLTRLTRSAMLEALNSEYVKMARLKGVPEWKVVWVHALRNAGVSILTFAGVLAVIMLSGSVVVETVFAWPGIGSLLIDAANARDFPVVQGVVLLFAALYIGANLVVDVLYAYLNPQIRYA